MTQRPAENKFPVIIIGGGASGLAAANILAQNKTPFLLIEKEKKLGRKLLATGNGRCNLFNTGEAVYFGEDGFAKSVLSACGIREVGAFFESIGLAFFEEELGRCYPLSRQAASVLDALLAGIAGFPGASIRMECEVKNLVKAQHGFEVTTNQGKYFADKVLLAAGSPASPKLGGTDSLISPLLALGHKALPFEPALCALITQTQAIKGLFGLRVPATLTLYIGENPVDAAAGEVLFADYGVSGLCAMQLARKAGEGLKNKQAVNLGFDFSALLGLKKPEYRRLNKAEWAQPKPALMKSLLEARLKKLGKDRLYTGLLPSQMARLLENKPMKEAVSFLCDLRLPVTGVKGFDQAQVASGGLVCAAFDPKSLESRLVPGLYASGEILNVDGDTGGFNLLFAWASGILAGRHLAL